MNKLHYASKHQNSMWIEQNTFNFWVSSPHSQKGNVPDSTGWPLTLMWSPNILFNHKLQQWVVHVYTM